MHRGTWKAFERTTATRLGGRRIPVTGLDRDGADVETPIFSIQCKKGRNRPSYLAAWLGGIRHTAAQAGKIGLVVWSEKHEDADDAIVMLALKDFQDLVGTLTPKGEQE